VQSSIWKIASYNPNKKRSNWLALLLAKNRGLASGKKLNEFLHPSFEQILSVKLTEVDKAVQRVKKAISEGEKIIVYSDYDADGICATAIMWETLYDLGANVMPYVPHRIKEGYGLGKPAITQLAKSQIKLIITVDHGVTAIEQVKYANELNVDVIITDHHVLPKQLPKSYAMVHTTSLCGAGVSWRLSWEIVKKLQSSYKNILLEKLELAALATIADLVPLTGANRAIVKLGLEKISQTKRPGIIALMKSSGISTKIGTYEIGHILAPRINAMGRIEHALDSLRLLCAKKQETADQLASLLTRTNTKRQDLTVKAVNHAMRLVNHKHLIGVISHETYHEGVIGLVASRLAESFNRPMIVISKGEIYSKGSARSISGFNIVEAIRASSEFLVDAGGHPMAAGFTIETRHIEIFAQNIRRYAQKFLTDDHLVPIINIECVLGTEDINQNTLAQIEKFEPYGVGNPQPVFLTRKMLLEDIRTVGADAAHLKLQVAGLSAIGFNMGQQKVQLRPGQFVDLVYTLSVDNYNNRGGIQLKVKDLTINS